MGLMDKVKAQATTLAQQTKETANAGKAKLDQSQANRRSDVILRNLGLAILAERTGRGTAETSGQINQLISELTTHEAQNNVNLVQQAAQAQAQQLANQTRPGDFLTSSDSAPDPNVSGAMPGAAPSYGGAPSYNAPASYPQSGGQTGFPDAGQPTSFPGAAPTGFPDAGQSSSFPGAAPTAFPASAPAGFPPATSFPEATPAGFGEPAPADEAPDPYSAPNPQSTGFPPSSDG